MDIGTLYIEHRKSKIQRLVPKASVFVVVFTILLIASCGPKEPPSVKQSRAIAAENIEIKKQLERRDREIETLKEQYEKEIKKQKKLFADCQQEKEDWKNKARQNIRNQVEPVLDAVVDETAKLREENTKLKAQIEQLQKEATQNKDSTP